MTWGYYCRTCGKSSPRWYDSPQALIQDFTAAHPGLHRFGPHPNDTTLPTVEMSIVTWLVRHHGHDLWAECESGVIHLESGRDPQGHTQLPGFVGRQLES